MRITANLWNDLVTALLEQRTQQGGHQAVTRCRRQYCVAYQISLPVKLNYPIGYGMAANRTLTDPCRRLSRIDRPR